ncbi:hypothetical protein JCM11491_003608 [Sporobolomyces phaffii]
MVLLAYYRDMPFLRIEQALTQINERVPAALRPLTRRYTQDIKATFANMQAKLLALAARLHAPRATALSQRSFFLEVFPPMEKLLWGCVIDHTLLPEKSWFENEVTDFTFRQARTRQDPVAPSLAHLGTLVTSVLNLRSPCGHGLAHPDHCALCSEYWHIYPSSCESILDEFGQRSRWHALSPDQQGRLVRIVSQVRSNVAEVLAHHQIPGDLLYLWIPSIHRVIEEVDSLAAGFQWVTMGFRSLYFHSKAATYISTLLSGT